MDWKKKCYFAFFKRFPRQFFDFYSHWESWFAQQQPTGCAHKNKINPNVLLLVEFNSRLWFCGLSCVITEERVISFNASLLKTSNNVNSRWLFIITHTFGAPFKMQLTKERRIPGKVSICVGNCYLNFSGGHLHSPAPLENPGKLPHTVSVGNVVVKIKQHRAVTC